MTKADVEAVLERVRSWPEDRQAEAATLLIAMEAEEGEVYELSEEEEADIAEALAELQRGEVATEEEVEAVLSRYRAK